MSATYLRNLCSLEFLFMKIFDMVEKTSARGILSTQQKWHTLMISYHSCHKVKGNKLLMNIIYKTNKLLIIKKDMRRYVEKEAVN